tara:strand:+ start:196 stop:474 length:279 start_codon:yes stop_codon:yes gene_type:complete
MDIINIITDNPIFIAIAILISILVLYSLFKKLFKLFALLVTIAVIYVFYLTQVEGLSFDEAKHKAKKIGKEIIHEGQDTLEDLQKKIEQKGN